MALVDHNANIIMATLADGNADDATANNRDGTVNGSVTNSLSYGKINEGFDFPSGTGNNITWGDESAWDLTNTPLTINLWINPDSVSSTVRLFSKEGTAGSRGWSLYIFNSGKVAFGDANGWRETANGAISTGSYQMVTAIYTNSGNMTGIIIHVNGSLISTSSNGTTNLPFQTNSNSVYWGTDRTGASQYDGKSDELTIWSGVALSTSEIVELYNSGDAIQYPFSGAPSGYTNPINGISGYSKINGIAAADIIKVNGET